MRPQLIAVLTIAALACVVATACDDDTPMAVKKPVVSEFKTLEQKDDILFNVELCFNKYAANEFDKLLDDDFVFFFSDADYARGITPAQWDRATEMKSYEGFFDPNRSEDRVISRSLRLTYPEDNWTEIDPPNPAQYPGEKWYVTTVRYDMAVVVNTVPELTYIANDMTAEFTIRWDETQGHWRVVVWRDDFSGGLRSVLANSTAVEETSWGSVKALYQ